ncbi:metallophosphoesterase [Seonamhaeicola sp.]|uniref:metallophosphoesterase family protein n=1 Tax=Seonamhaeicola sp. TaxID=1912245 RepID=UPI002634D37F|nr:metallophosphoesterase [Seonamhaeicola sp.]
MKHTIIIISVSWLLVSCIPKHELSKNSLQIAFMADVHLQDIYGEFQDSHYEGVKNPKTGKFTLARTMKSQLQSTRLFNENYFAFIAALDDVVSRGIRYVVLPGDFSDDGQLLNIRGLREILNTYSERHNIKFIATTGNHDPVRPFFQDAGKPDFLGAGGKQQPIYSKEGMYVAKDTLSLPVVISKDIAKLGYDQILGELSAFGFFPKKTDVYWETPFSSYAYENYKFQEALQQSELSQRQYKIPPINSLMPDVSYLVEPGENLWFLAIDANVYVPKENIKNKELNPISYHSASIGYNNVLTHKKHLIPWVHSVTNRAEQLGKTLIVFSHYPMVEFNDGASKKIRSFFGNKKMQLHRVPHDDVADAFTEAGVNVHFGGHMHINDTGIRTTKKGQTIINIQIPSLAAYIPAYKILTVHSNTEFEIETVVMDSVPGFNNLFPLYAKEYEYLQSVNDSKIWNKDVLKAQTYKEFTQWHLKELVRLRFLPNDWPPEFLGTFSQSTGRDLLLLDTALDVDVLNKTLKDKGLVLDDFGTWTGFDMIFDFYRLRSADELAIPDIGLKQLEQYKIVCDKLKQSGHSQFQLWSAIFKRTTNGQPSNHFTIDLKSNTIQQVSAE